MFEKTLHRFANGSYYFSIEDVSQLGDLQRLQSTLKVRVFLLGRFSAQTILRHHVRNIHVDLDVPGPTKAKIARYFHIGL